MSPTYHMYVSDRGNVFMTEVAALLAATVADLGREVVFPAPGLPAPGAGRVNVVVAPHEFFALQSVASDDELLRAAEASVTVGVEQPGTEWFETGLRYSGVAAAVLDISRVAVSELVARGVDARHLQLGYHRSWDHWGGEAGRARPTDVVFLGSLTERRERLLAGMAALLWDCRCDLRLFEYPRPMTSPRANFVAAADKWELLAASRVLINLHRNDVAYLEWVRILEAVVNGCVVVSEAAMEAGPLTPGEHLVLAPADAVGAYAASLALDEDRRQEMAGAAYELVRSRLDMVNLAAPLLDHAEAASARLGPPRRILPAPPAPPGRPENPLIRDVLASDTRIRARVKELIDSETALIRKVESLQARLQWGDADHETEFETPAWAARPGRVSVVVTSYNTETLLGDAIASVMDSSGVAVELVVVDDHSDDASVALVRRIIDERPDYPLRLVVRSANGGVSAARNSGLARARGEHVFILDSDNRIYPNTLERLAGALDASPDAAFAYGIITKGDGSGLLSYLPWDLPRLCQSNYIDAMALLRRSVFDDIGGYDAHFGLLGWEDYELWLRAAAAGLSGELVTSFVGTYSVRPGSRQETVNLDSPAIMRELRQIYPYLPWPESN